MSKQRIINTRFWIDDYVSNLDPIEKLLFLYLLTNPSTEICGVYELPLNVMAVQTGIDKYMVSKILRRFENDKKIIHKRGWVIIINFVKHQNTNPSVLKGIERSLLELPLEIRSIYDKVQSGNSLSEPPLLNLTKLNLTKPTDSEQSSQIKEVMDIFYKINPTLNWGNKTIRKSCQDLIKRFGLEGTIKMAKMIVEIQGQPYAPVATTPYQMKEKLAQFKIYFDKEKNKKNEFKIL